jgi:hypothetical protein
VDQEISVCLDKMSTDDWEVICETPEVPPAPGIYAIRSIHDPSRSYSMKLNKVHGHNCSSHIHQDRWNDLDQKINYRASDILLATYPKCGTTWIEQCLLLLLNQGDPSTLNPAMKNVYIPGSAHPGKIWIEPSLEQNPELQNFMGLEARPLSLDDYNSAPEPRVIKTHAPVSIVIGGHLQGIQGLNARPKIVVVTRNPLDACVSCYYHAFNPYKCGWPFEAWAAMWFKGMVPNGSWYDWVKGWYEAKVHYPDDILWIQYEDVQANKAAVITSLANFTGIAYNDELIAKVVAGSSFESMKEKAMEQGGDIFGHLRKGTSGDWKNHFTPELVEEFRRKYESSMQGTALRYSLGSDEEFKA